MGFLVQCKLGGNSEGLATLCTLVWLVACVAAQVHIEIGDTRESLATELTVVGLLTCVGAQVLSKI